MLSLNLKKVKIGVNLQAKVSYNSCSAIFFSWHLRRQFWSQIPQSSDDWKLTKFFAQKRDKRVSLRLKIFVNSTERKILFDVLVLFTFLKISWNWDVDRSVTRTEKHVIPGDQFINLFYRLIRIEQYNFNVIKNRFIASLAKPFEWHFENAAISFWRFSSIFGCLLLFAFH